MSTATKTRVKAPAKSTASKPAPSDAIDMLTTDHKAVKALFKQYDKLAAAGADADEKQAIAQPISSTRPTSSMRPPRT